MHMYMNCNYSKPYTAVANSRVFCIHGMRLILAILLSIFSMSCSRGHANYLFKSGIALPNDSVIIFEEFPEELEDTCIIKFQSAYDWEYVKKHIESCMAGSDYENRYPPELYKYPEQIDLSMYLSKSRDMRVILGVDSAGDYYLTMKYEGDD